MNAKELVNIVKPLIDARVIFASKETALAKLWRGEAIGLYHSEFSGSEKETEDYIKHMEELFQKEIDKDKQQ